MHVAELATTRRNLPLGPASVDPRASDGHSVVIVAYTWPEPRHGTEVVAGRMVSARKVTAHERRAYEEGDF